MRSQAFLAVLLTGAVATSAAAQGVRSHTRLKPRGTTVSKTQAIDLTLTVTAVATRLIQVWVRSAGTVDPARRVVTVFLSPAEAATVKVDQRARAFPVESRSSMYQARVVRVVPDGRRVRVDVALQSEGREGARRYVVEIVTEPGSYLSVPNEAIIEEGDRRIVYVQQGEGEYEPKPVETGLQGELLTQVLGGLREGEQVVTFGSFFIDSEYKLKGTAQGQ
jgi:hypothetical protein